MAIQEASPLGPHATLPVGNDRPLTWACRETGPPEPPKLRLLDRVRQAVSRTLAGLVLLLAIAAVGPPIDAQPATRIPKIGLLSTTTQVTIAPWITGFRQGLREHGYAEGKTVLLEVRFAEGVVERLPELARQLVALKPDVIVATNDPAIAAVRRETQTIPIVMAFSSDPAGAGFVASLARPGGNVTGLSNLSPEVSGKRLELLREVVPGLSRIALLWNQIGRASCRERV